MITMVKKGTGPFDEELVINNHIIRPGLIMHREDGFEMMYFDLEDQDVIDEVLSHDFDKFPKKSISIEFKHRHELDEDLYVFQVTVVSNPGGNVNMLVDLDFDVLNWDRGWSINEHSVHLKALLMKRFSVDTSNNRESGTSIRLITLPESMNESMDIHMQKWIVRIQEIQMEVIQSLLLRVRSEALVTLFNFPEEVRVPCEQYLLYFVQFLKDVGVDATADLQHKSGQVLFAVIPTDPSQALDVIKQALEIYLQLPAAQGLDLTPSNNIQVQQLVSNVHHLKGQLALASAMLQAKDATIQAQQLTISQQQLFLTGEVMSRSVVDIEESKSQDGEDLLGGAVSLTTYEGPGFNVNIAHIYRMVKDLFSKSDYIN